MKRLTFDLVLAGLLAAAPLAAAQQDLEVPGAIKNRNDTSPAGPRPTPSTTRRNTPPFPGDEPVPPQRVPPDVPPVGMPTPATTGAERAGDEPLDASPPMAGRPGTADSDVRLLHRLQDLNEKELKIAQLAADKARSARVKSYARTLVSHHKAVQRQLMSYVDKRGLTSHLQRAAATETPAPAGTDMHARLLGETGAEFDQDFVATMVDDHDRAIELVRTARDSAVDPQLRDLFHELLPKLEKQRKTGQQLLEKHLKT